MFEGRIFVRMQDNAADKTEKSESRVRVTTAGSTAHPVPRPPGIAQASAWEDGGKSFSCPKPLPAQGRDLSPGSDKALSALSFHLSVSLGAHVHRPASAPQHGCWYTCATLARTLRAPTHGHTRTRMLPSTNLAPHPVGKFTSLLPTGGVGSMSLYRAKKPQRDPRCQESRAGVSCLRRAVSRRRPPEWPGPVTGWLPSDLAQCPI